MPLGYKWIGVAVRAGQHRRTGGPEVALTLTQKKWAVGGTIAAAALAVGYGLFHSRPAHAGLLPVGHPGHPGHGRHEHRQKFSHPEDRGERSQENARGEYGRKKKHHRHREHKHG